MFRKETYVRRRSELRKRIEGGLVLLPGNGESPANYPSNQFRFRQDSTLPILLRPEPSRLRRADGYRLGRGNALRRRLHDRRHHLDGSATDPRRAGPGGRHRQDATAVATRQADRSGRRQGAQGPFPASLPGRNDAADRPAARSRARAGSALRLGRAGQGGRSAARDQGRRRNRPDRKGLRGSAARCTAWL